MGLHGIVVVVVVGIGSVFAKTRKKGQ